MPAFRPVRERLLEKVEVVESGCHEWRGFVMHSGYGQISVNGRAEYAHRVAFQIHSGNDPMSLYVMHTCDNRKCVNPEHLFAGTFYDNMSDMVAKGRHAKGDKSGRRKLTMAKAEAIRRETGTQHEIANRYGVSRATIALIKAGKTWKGS